MTSPLLGVQSITMSVFVCLSVCPLAYIKSYMHYGEIFYSNMLHNLQDSEDQTLHTH